MSHTPHTPPEIAAVEHDAQDPDRRHRSRRRALRAAAYAASLALLAWAALVIPLPYTEFVPGAPTSIPPLIEIDGIETTEIQGDTSLLTVLLQPSTTRTAIGAMLDGDRELRRTSELIPDEVDRDEYLEQERLRFRLQFEVAAAVGAQAAGIDVDFHPVIVDAIPGGPSEGVLQTEDLVLRIDGEPVRFAEDVQRLVQQGSVGDTLAVEVERDGEAVTEEVTLKALEDAHGGQDAEGPATPDETPVLGVLVETIAEDLPFDVELAETRIGGPSAGLMVAVTVYDLLSAEDLVAGREIHGTGSITASGQVGIVGGVPEKMRAAGAADLVLVPEPLIEEALQAAPDGLDVVGVATFDEALEALRETR